MWVIGHLAIEIDTGSFHKDVLMTKPSAYKKELFFSTLELKKWLQKNYPEMTSYLEARSLEEIDKSMDPLISQEG